MTPLFSQQDIEAIVPHRYENILIDQVEKGEENGIPTGKLKVTLQAQDRLGRDIFFKQKNNTHKTILVPAIMEILALGSIVCSDKVNPGFPVLFTSISNFIKYADYALGTPVIGKVKRTKDKGSFMVCAGTLETESGELLASGDMMAFFPGPDTKSAEGPKKTLPIPEENHHQALAKNPEFKNVSMYVCDRSWRYVPETLEFVGQYTYPLDHPFTKGHFPGNPVMMGVMQWMCVEDNCLLLSQLLGKPGNYKLKGQADIMKADGTPVSEIKGFTVQIYGAENGTLPQAEMIQTDKIVFRDLVKPGETLFVSLSSLEIID